MALSVYIDGLPVEFLPDTCNDVRPFGSGIDRMALVDSYYLFDTVGIVHMSGQTTVRHDPHAKTEIPDRTGAPVAASLRYGYFQRDARATPRRPDLPNGPSAPRAYSA